MRNGYKPSYLMMHSLNPYSNGRYSMGVGTIIHTPQSSGLNPYSNGRYSMGYGKR